MINKNAKEGNKTELSFYEKKFDRVSRQMDDLDEGMMKTLSKIRKLTIQVARIERTKKELIDCQQRCLLHIHDDSISRIFNPISKKD